MPEDVTSFRRMVVEQAALHPAMQPQDAVKLCYQAAFGAEHLLVDEHSAMQRLQQELDSVAAAEGRLWEPISHRFARVNLAVWKQRGLPVQQLFALFHNCVEASNKQDGDALFQRCLAGVEEATREDMMPFTVVAWQAFVNEYLAQGIRPMHHSAAYQAAEQPHYRLVRITDIQNI